MRGDPSEPLIVLVAEDDEQVRLTLTMHFENEGFLVLEAANGDSALKLLEVRSDVHLLFTDIHMPGKLNGISLAREVHKRWLVLSSGHRLQRPQNIPSEARFLAKPYRLAELREHVSELIGSP